MDKHIYCDMDGVLVDFLTGAIAHVNNHLNQENHFLSDMAEEAREELGRDYVIPEDLEKYGPLASDAARKYMYYLLEDDREFWAQLPWMPGGQELWEHIKIYNPSILTSPMDKKGKKGSILGKLDWLNENLGLDTNREVIFAHNKYEYATNENGGSNILIDDFLSKIGPWREHGGDGIHHLGDPSTTIATLEEVRNESAIAVAN